MSIAVQDHALALSAEWHDFCEKLTASSGAVVSFVGFVRDFSQTGESLRAMHLEHYPGMTETCLARIAEKARKSHALDAVRLIHRVGRLAPGEPIVLVFTASRHRKQAFEACAAIVDWLKTEAPFWKSEHCADGQHHWVRQD